MNGIPHKASEFVQFCPTQEAPNYPGVLGWGFDIKNFRVVMYIPEEYDHTSVRSFYKKSQQPRLRVGEDLDYGENGDYRPKNRDRRGLKQPYRRHRMPARGEHPPAHVHVYNLSNGREARYELISSHDGNDYMRPLFHASEQDGNLNRKDRNFLQPVLEETASGFIQLWQEKYQDRQLSAAVTRTSEVEGEVIEEHVKKKVWLVQIDSRGSRSISPLPDLRTRVRRNRDEEDEHYR